MGVQCAGACPPGKGPDTEGPAECGVPNAINVPRSASAASSARFDVTALSAASNAGTCRPSA
jgi:hypothetical protein